MIDIDPKLQKYFQSLSNVQIPSFSNLLETIQSPAITAAMNNLQPFGIASAVDDLQSLGINNMQPLGIGIASAINDLQFLGINNMQSLGIASAISDLQSSNFVTSMQMTASLMDTMSLKNIFSETTTVLKQYQELSDPDDFKTCEAAISILDTNIQQAENKSIISYEEQMIDVSGKQDILAFIEQHQDVLFDIINEQLNEQQQEEKKQTQEQLPKEISVKEIGKNLSDLLGILAAIYTLFPDTTQYIIFKMKLISFTIQIIIAQVFLLPF